MKIPMIFINFYFIKLDINNVYIIINRLVKICILYFKRIDAEYDFIVFSNKINLFTKIL